MSPAVQLGLVITFFSGTSMRRILFQPLGGEVLIIRSANLFASGITIDIAIGFIFLIFFILGSLPLLNFPPHTFSHSWTSPGSQRRLFLG